MFDAETSAVSIASTPPLGVGINQLSCTELNCALIDQGAREPYPRFSFSADGGTTWSNPLDIPWASGETITSLSCGAVFDCVVSALSRTHQLELYVTRDDGVTWTSHPTPSSWSSLTSLSCEATRCEGLATISGVSSIVHSTTFARTWKKVALASTANALACIDTTCVVGGQTKSAAAWLATFSKGVTSTIALRYVPTPLLDVACGSKVCAAIGVTTLLKIPLFLKSGR
jgi:hypothetical protein